MRPVQEVWKRPLGTEFSFGQAESTQAERKEKGPGLLSATLVQRSATWWLLLPFRLQESRALERSWLACRAAGISPLYDGC